MARLSLLDMLLAAGLGPTHPDADDIRNVMVSPTAGIDPQQHLDALPLARGLLAHIERDAGCRSLSPKFSFLVDGGEGVAVIGHPHDVWLASMDGGEMALGFAGSPPARADDKPPFLAVPADRAINAVATVIRLFLEAAAGDPAIVRFRDLFSRVTRERFLDRLSQELGTRQRHDAEIITWRRKPFRSGLYRHSRPAAGGNELYRRSAAARAPDARDAEADRQAGGRRRRRHHSADALAQRDRAVRAAHHAADVLGALASIGFVTAPRDPIGFDGGLFRVSRLPRRTVGHEVRRPGPRRGAQRNSGPESDKILADYVDFVSNSGLYQQSPVEWFAEPHTVMDRAPTNAARLKILAAFEHSGNPVLVLDVALQKALDRT